MKKIFNKEFKIGLSIIVAALILIFGIEYLKGINLFNPANFYYCEYDNVNDLSISAPVTVNGYKVGQVREISFDYAKPGKVKVLLAVNKNLHLPEDSEAKLASTLLSGAYIEIKLGKSSTLLERGASLKATEGTDLMSSLSNDLMPAVYSVIPKIDSLLTSLNTLVSDPALSTSINRLDGITSNVFEVTAGLKTTVNKDVPLVMRNVNSITHGIDTVVANLAVLSYQLKTLPLNATMDNVEEITNNLTQFSKSLNNAESTLGKLTNDPALYNRLNRVATDVDSLILDIKQNPKRYINIKVF